jgi:protein-disulfide isomerase
LRLPVAKFDSTGFVPNFSVHYFAGVSIQLPSMRRYLPFLIVAIVAAVAIGGGAALYRAKRPQTLTISKERAGSTATESGEVHMLGPADAPVTLEEFGDFQCPPCGKLSQPINELQHDYNRQVRLIFRNFPLINHLHAREAAYAAEAAGLQGRFWQMHDVLYREQAVWSNSLDARALFSAYAGYIGLNTERFKLDMDSEKVKARVDADQKQGLSLGVKNTPTIFLNNKEIDPKNLNPMDLRAAVDGAVKKAKPSS